MPRKRTRPGQSRPGEFPAEFQGQRSALRDLRQAAPTGPSPTAPGPTAPGPTASPLEGMPAPNVFGATQRPAEPLTAGAPLGPGPGPDLLPSEPTADDILRAIYAKFPNPYILRLIDPDR